MIMELTITERVAKGAAFLDEHFTGWWERIDLNTLNIDSCDNCVLGQLWCTAPQEEQGQIVAQAVQSMVAKRWDLQMAHQIMREQTPYGRIATAYEELNLSGTWDLGFNYGNPTYADLDEAQDLTDEWTRVVIQRRLDAHPDVILGCSDLSKFASEQYAAVI